MNGYTQVPDHADPEANPEQQQLLDSHSSATNQQSQESSISSYQNGTQQQQDDEEDGLQHPLTLPPSETPSDLSMDLSISEDEMESQLDPPLFPTKNIISNVESPTRTTLLGPRGTTGTSTTTIPITDDMATSSREKEVIDSSTSFDVTPRISNATHSQENIISPALASGIPKSPTLSCTSLPTHPTTSSTTTPLNHGDSKSKSSPSLLTKSTRLTNSHGQTPPPSYGLPRSSSSSSSPHKKRTPSSSSMKRIRSSQSRSKSPNKPKTLLQHLSYIMTDDDSVEGVGADLRSTPDSGRRMLSPEEAMARRTPRNLTHPRALFYYFHLERRGMKRLLVGLTLVFIAFSVWNGNTSGGGGFSWNQETDHSDEYYSFYDGANETYVAVTTEEADCPVSNEQVLLNLRDESSVNEVDHGVVAADDGLCSEMGVSILRHQGGNAVDAAVTTAFCLGVVNPASSGIGGGGFILIHMNDSEGDGWNHRGHPGTKPVFDDARERNQEEQNESSPDGVTELIDCREVAPSRATSDMYTKLSPEASVIGPLSIGVPGELKGLELAHYRYGKLSWGQVMGPVVQLAEQGVPVSRWLADEINNIRKAFELNGVVNASDPFMRMITKDNDGVTFLQEGDIMRRPEFASTLRSIMENGASHIYSGNVAKSIANDIQKSGGIITAEDIMQYRPTIRDPLVANVKGFNIVSTPPPSSGGAVIIGVLRFLSGYLDPFATFADALSKHRMVEAFKHGFAIRMSMSDPAFNADVTKAAVADLIKGPYMEELRQNTSDTWISPLSEYGGAKWAQINSTDDKVYAKDAKEGDRRLRGLRSLRGFNYLEDHGTSHLSVVDKGRNAVSITSSINFHFGSKFISPSTGILFNDQMDDFATPGRPNTYGLHPSESNYVSPGKRPLSSMAPTMLFHPDGDSTRLGRLFMVLGSSGGPKIITSVIQVILNHAFLGIPLYEAVTRPRIHDQLLYHMAAATGYDKSKLNLQPGKPIIEVRQRTLKALEKRGHHMFTLDYLGTTQAVAVDLETDKLTAVSDVRKNGQSAGY